MAFLRRNERDALYHTLSDRLGCGPFDGGCVAFAMALRQRLGGEVHVLINAHGRADHAVLCWEGRLIDMDGPASARGMVQRFQRLEGVTLRPGSRPIQPDDLPGASRAADVVDALACHLPKDLAARLRKPRVQDETPEWPFDLDRVVRQLRLRDRGPQTVVRVLAQTLQALGFSAQAVQRTVRVAAFDAQDYPQRALWLKEQTQYAVAWEGRLWSTYRDASWDLTLHSAWTSGFDLNLTRDQEAMEVSFIDDERRVPEADGTVQAAMEPRVAAAVTLAASMRREGVPLLPGEDVAVPVLGAIATRWHQDQAQDRATSEHEGRLEPWLKERSEGRLGLGSTWSMTANDVLNVCFSLAPSPRADAPLVLVFAKGLSLDALVEAASNRAPSRTVVSATLSPEDSAHAQQAVLMDQTAPAAGSTRNAPRL